MSVHMTLTKFGRPQISGSEIISKIFCTLKQLGLNASKWEENTHIDCSQNRRKIHLILKEKISCMYYWRESCMNLHFLWVTGIKISSSTCYNADFFPNTIHI